MSSFCEEAIQLVFIGIFPADMLKGRLQLCDFYCDSSVVVWMLSASRQSRPQNICMSVKSRKDISLCTCASLTVALQLQHCGPRTWLTRLKGCAYMVLTTLCFVFAWRSPHHERSLWSVDVQLARTFCKSLRILHSNRCFVNLTVTRHVLYPFTYALYVFAMFCVSFDYR